jgi:hypothetical protein
MPFMVSIRDLTDSHVPHPASHCSVVSLLKAMCLVQNKQFNRLLLLVMPLVKD